MNKLFKNYVILPIIFSVFIFIFIKLPETLSSTIKSYTHLSELFNNEDLSDIHIFESTGSVIQNTSLGRLRTSPLVDNEPFKTTLHLTDYYNDLSDYEYSINNITEIYNDPLFIIFQTKIKENQIYKLERTFYLTTKPNDKIILSEKFMSKQNAVLFSLHDVKLICMGSWSIQTTLIEITNKKEVIAWNNLSEIRNEEGISEEQFNNISLSKCFLNNFTLIHP